MQKKFAQIRLFIKSKDCPDRICEQKVRSDIVERFELKNDKVNISKIQSGGLVEYSMKIECDNPESIVVALEMFSRLLYGVKIYRRILEYKNG